MYQQNVGSEELVFLKDLFTPQTQDFFSLETRVANSWEFARVSNYSVNRSTNLPWNVHRNLGMSQEISLV